MGPKRQTGRIWRGFGGQWSTSPLYGLHCFFPRFLNNKGYLKRGCCASGCVGGGGGGAGGVGVQRQVQAAGDWHNPKRRGGESQRPSAEQSLLCLTCSGSHTIRLFIARPQQQRQPMARLRQSGFVWALIQPRIKQGRGAKSSLKNKNKTEQNKTEQNKKEKPVYLKILRRKATRCAGWQLSGHIRGTPVPLLSG